ncbi:MAG: carbohydrate kinase [Proteobacteria bacterium]|nr:carbohydrate kinase [Pseudomonadota bacterium]
MDEASADEASAGGAGAFVVCGEALIDLVPLGSGTDHAYRATCGGSPFNVAIGLGRLGARAHFMGRLSRDPNGERLAARLAANGVALDLVARGDAPQMLAYVFPPEPGRPDVGYAFYLDGTSGAAPEAADMAAPLPADLAAVHFGSFSAVLPRSGPAIRDFVRRSGAFASYDLNLRPTITPDRDAVRAAVAECAAVAGIVKLSDADADWLFPGRGFDDLAEDWLRGGASLVAMTRGPEGALLRTASARVSAPGVPTTVVDTVGAGDTFMAALLWGLGRRDLLQAEALSAAPEAALAAAAALACRAAAIVCTRRGAEPPTAAELGA